MIKDIFKIQRPVLLLVVLSFLLFAGQANGAKSNPMGQPAASALANQAAAAAHTQNPAAVQVVSEGLQALNAPAWHTAGIQGSGVKVAIIDRGFLGYSALLGSELPYSTTVKNFVDGQSDLEVDSGTAQGTACAEIVHDIAPQAALYLAKISSPSDLAEAVNWLIGQDVDIISTSTSWYNLTPGDGSGFFADLAQNARANGIVWLAAAGDSRQLHWDGSSNDLNGDSYHDYAINSEINYFVQSNGDPATIPTGSPLRGYLRWSDWTVVDQDYDLQLMRFDAIQGWKVETTSSNHQSGLPGQTPTETIEYTTEVSGYYGFRIISINSTRPVDLEFFAEGPAPLIHSVAARSLPNLADAADVITVSTVNAAAPYTQEVYSSEGPTNGPGGTLEGGQNKPDLAAYDRVSTASYGAGAFTGSAAAVSHAAGAAALVKSINTGFTPGQIEGFLQYLAIDLGNPGWDAIYGNGRVYLGDPLAFFSPPEINNLPDQYVPINGSLDAAIDLWQYASDGYALDSQLTFTIDSVSAYEAGVSLRENRYIDIHPYSGWTGQAQVGVRVTNPYNLSDTDFFNISVYPYKIWNGSANTDWQQSANWTPPGAPTTSDQVVLPLTTHQPVLSAPAAVLDLTVDPGASLDLAQYPLSVERTMINQGTLLQDISAAAGETTSVLRLTNQAGDQVKYLGLEITIPLPPGSQALPSATLQLRAAVSGEQYCTGRFTGVKRCYEIQTDQPLNAGLRFYFSAAEADSISLQTLAVFLQSGGWIEQQTGYSNGSSGPFLYLQAADLAAQGRFALDSSGRGPWIVLLPLMHK